MKNVDFPIGKAVWFSCVQVELARKAASNGGSQSNLIEKHPGQECSAGMLAKDHRDASASLA
jgi:hypothetical protein